MLINDLIINQGRGQNARAENSLELFLGRVKSELQFIGRACELTPAQQAALDKAGLDVFEKFAKALQAPAANRAAAAPASPVQRLGVIDGQVVVIDAQGVAQAFIPDGILRGQLDAAVRKALPEELSAKLQAERERIGRKAHEADLLATLAAIDEAMLLSPDERERFRGYLAANWKPAWGQIASGSQSPGAAATPLQRAKACGLGGVFDLFDADLEPLLNPTQMAAWREMRTLLRTNPQPLQVAVQRRVVVRQGRIVQNQVEQRAALQRQIVVQQEELQRQAVRLRELQQRQADRQRAVVQGGIAAAPAAPAVIPVQQQAPAIIRPQLPAPDVVIPYQSATAPSAEPPAELALYLNLLVADAALSCELSESQRETLLLAGKLDIKHYQDKRRQAADELQQQAKALGANLRMASKAESAAALNPFAEASSRYRKALGAKLSEDQRRRLSAAERARRELAGEAAVQSLVREFDERTLLTSKQWDALAEILRQRLPAWPDDAIEPDSEELLLRHLASATESEIRRPLDEDQWAAASLKLNELKRIVLQREALQFERQRLK